MRMTVAMEYSFYNLLLKKLATENISDVKVDFTPRLTLAFFNESFARLRNTSCMQLGT